MCEQGSAKGVITRSAKVLCTDASRSDLPTDPSKNLHRNRSNPRQLNAFKRFKHSTAAGAHVRDFVG